MTAHSEFVTREFLVAVAVAIGLHRRGYRFVSLAEALADPAYEVPDRYEGPRGPSWLQRWAITMGRDPGEQPPVSGWVRRLASGR